MDASASAGCQAPGPAGTPGCSTHREAGVNAIDPETVDDIDAGATVDADADGDGWGESLEVGIDRSSASANRAGFTANWVSEAVGGGGGAGCGTDGPDEQERGITINTACQSEAAAPDTATRCKANGRKTVKPGMETAGAPASATEGDDAAFQCTASSPVGAAALGCSGDLDGDGLPDAVVCNPGFRPSDDGSPAGLP